MLSEAAKAYFRYIVEEFFRVLKAHNKDFKRTITGATTQGLYAAGGAVAGGAVGGPFGALAGTLAASLYAYYKAPNYDNLFVVLGKLDDKTKEKLVKRTMQMVGDKSVASFQNFIKEPSNMQKFTTLCTEMVPKS